MGRWQERLHWVIPLVHTAYPLLSAAAATTAAARRWRRVGDLLYLYGWVTPLYLHWVLWGECILNVWEKRAYDPAYRAGDCPAVKPFQRGRPPPAALEALFFLVPFLVLWRAELPAALRWGTALLHAAIIAHQYATAGRGARTPRCRALAGAVARGQGRRDDGG